MRVGILGAGAIGTVFAAALSEVATSVSILAREPQASYLEVEGLEMTFSNGDVRRYPPSSWSILRPGDLAPEVDLLLLSAKASSTRELAPIASQWLAPLGYVISLQNGLGHAHQLGLHCGHSRVIPAITTHGANRQGPGHTHWAGVGEVILGNSGESPSDAMQPILDLFAKASLHPRWSTSIDSEIWLKLIYNAAINPIASICGITNGEILSSPDLRAYASSIVQEATRMGHLHGADLPPLLEIEAGLDHILTMTSNNECSMLQDLKAGRKTEIESICGVLIETSEEHGVPIPTLRAVYALVRSLEAGILV